MFMNVELGGVDSPGSSAEAFQADTTHLELYPPPIMNSMAEPLS